MKIRDDVRLDILRTLRRVREDQDAAVPLRSWIPAGRLQRAVERDAVASRAAGGHHGERHGGLADDAPVRQNQRIADVGEMSRPQRLGDAFGKPRVALTRPVVEVDAPRRAVQQAGDCHSPQAFVESASGFARNCLCQASDCEDVSPGFLLALEKRRHIRLSHGILRTFAANGDL